MAKKRRLRKKEQYIREVISDRTGMTSYQFEYRYTDIAGNPAREVKTFSEKEYGSADMAKRAAVRYRDQFVRQNETIGIPIKKKTTVQELYEKKFELFPRSVKTMKHHESYYRCYIKDDYGERDIQSITSEDIQICLNKMISTKSDDMISNVFGIWKDIFKTAAFLKLSVIDQTVMVEKPKSKAPIKKRQVLLDAPSIEDICERIMARARMDDKSYFNHMILCYIVKVMYYTGMRPAECFALSRDEIDLKSKTIAIRYAIGSNTVCTRVLIPTKTKESQAVIPIVPQLEPILQELMMFTDHYYLFQDWDGEFLETDQVSDRINHIFKDAPYKFNLYNLRHQFATDLTLIGTDIRTVQELMRHADAKMTLSYARSNTQKKEEALINRFLN